MLPIDRWALYAFNELVRKMRQGYDTFEFHQAFHALHNFCVVDMSNFYLDVIKDRLYVEKADSVERRAAQTAMYRILDGLTRLMSPILAFTSDEIWHAMPHRACDDRENVVFNLMPEVQDLSAQKDFIAGWDQIHAIRDVVKKALELARAEKVIGASLDAKVVLFCDEAVYAFAKSVEEELAAAFIVSQIEICQGGDGTYRGEVPGLSVTVMHADGEKCPRCWSYGATVGSDAAFPEVSRDAQKRCNKDREN